jgi:homoserine O-succinyltransferase
MPHSRWNEIPEEALLACGYRVLTRSEDAGVDAFVKQRNSLFVFFQGHPEYDADDAAARIPPRYRALSAAASETRIRRCRTVISTTRPSRH